MNMPEQQEWPLDVESAAVANYLNERREALQKALANSVAELQGYLQGVATKMGLDNVRYDPQKRSFIRVSGRELAKNGRLDEEVPAKK